jgi:hypothetical protein
MAWTWLLGKDIFWSNGPGDLLKGDFAKVSKEHPMSIITISRGSYSHGKEVAENWPKNWAMSAFPGKFS